jgi:predicted polyphosphate/ATP-dependent NAD kinase
MTDRPDNRSTPARKIGVIVNPIAGIGGSVALKGSDGGAVAAARARGASPVASGRARQALEQLAPAAERIEVMAWSEQMGGEAARAAGILPMILHPGPARLTTAADTRRAATAMASRVDLLLFAGGDGTAVDILRAVGIRVPVLGIPAGVKMHSAVFAVTPRAAGRLARMVVDGECQRTRMAEVADVDEELLRRGIVSASLRGCLRVPEGPALTQTLKTRGAPIDNDSIDGIARDLRERLGTTVLGIIGPGTTTSAILDRFGLPSTLLGVDVVRDSRLLASDVTESDVLRLLDGQMHAKVIVAPVGGQGFVLGRGNQQISPRVLRRVGRPNIVVVATDAKIAALRGRRLLVDTGDDALDGELAGFIKILAGYHREIVYKIAA